jgi:hypothetical protein
VLLRRQDQGAPGPAQPRAPSQGIQQCPSVLTDAELDKRWPVPVIGNRRSGIYHLPTHLNYGDVHPASQALFWTERDAQADGYRRARNDHYGQGSGVVRTEAAAARAPAVLRALERLTRQLGVEETPAHGSLHPRLHDQGQGIGR